MKNIGRETEVLIEKQKDKSGCHLKGITRNYLTVNIQYEKEDLFNTLQKVKITEYKNGIIYGKLAD